MPPTIARSASAATRVSALLRRQSRAVGGVFLIILGLVALATGASVLATAALWLVGFVPFIGLTVLPLQLLAWVLRGLIFQFIALASVGAYLKIYRTESAAGGRAAAGSRQSLMTDYTRFLSPTGRQLTESAIRRMGTVVARTGDIVSFAPGYPDASLVSLAGTAGDQQRPARWARC